jgi:hypothetical protein
MEFMKDEPGENEVFLDYFLKSIKRAEARRFLPSIFEDYLYDNPPLPKGGKGGLSCFVEPASGMEVIRHYLKMGDSGSK